MSTPEQPPEHLLNPLLRQVDWRFLLRGEDPPRTMDFSSGGLAEALGLVTQPAPGADGDADLVVLDHPTGASLSQARAALRPGGQVACFWWKPRAAGVQLARRRLRRGGFGEPRFYWPGPQGAPKPEFWLPLDSPAAIEHVFSQDPPRTRREAALRLAWGAVARCGALSPACAVASAQPEEEGEATRPLSESGPWVLLTPGRESGSKVVGLPFADGSKPEVVAKFARTEEADLALDREASVLRQLVADRPELTGIPRVNARGRRVGRSVVVQEALHGTQMHAVLDADSFAGIARRMTAWLVALAGRPAPQPPSGWSQRLVADPLDELERDFGSLVPAGFPQRARRALAGLGNLPLVWEHRDLGPWNVVLMESGAPGVFDWEYAEPQGLPGLDLTYFLASCAFSIEARRAGVQGVEQVRESYARLLDPGTDRGRVVAECVADYCARTGADPSEFPRLRLLCWIVQALILYRQRSTSTAMAEGTDESFFIHLAGDELVRLEDSP